MLTLLRLMVLLALLGPIGACACELGSEAADFAGAGAVDCGEVAVGEPAASGFACVLEAFDAGTPFLLTIVLQGVDSHVAKTWAGRADGETAVLVYDGDPSGGGGDDDPHVDRWRCGGPHRHVITEADLDGAYVGVTLSVGDEVLACDTVDFDRALCP